MNPIRSKTLQCYACSNYILDLFMDSNLEFLTWRMFPLLKEAFLLQNKKKKHRNTPEKMGFLFLKPGSTGTLRVHALPFFSH